MDAFIEMGPSVTDTLVTALTKLSPSQEAMDSRLNEMSRKFKKRNTTVTNNHNDFQKNQTQQPQSNSSQNRGQSLSFQDEITEEILEAASEVAIENSEGFDRIINGLSGRISAKIRTRHDNSNTKFFRNKIRIPLFGRNPLVFNLSIKTLKIKVLRIET